MQDSPLRLLEDNIEKYVLEVSDAQTQPSLAECPLPDAVRADLSEGVSRFYSNDIDRLKDVANALDGKHYYLRQANLEDVFLKTTGRGLNEKQ